MNPLQGYYYALLTEYMFRRKNANVVFLVEETVLLSNT